MTVLHATTLLVGAVAVLAGLRAVAHLAIRLCLAAPRVVERGSPADLGLAYQTVRIPTANRKELHGWLIPAGGAGPAPAVVVVHGWGGNAEMMLPLARPLQQAGFTSLFIDARCHGGSDGDTFASLPRFAEDVRHAHAWLAARPEVDAAHIALLGHSVGAGAALLAAAERTDVAAVVSVSAFAHPAEITRRWLNARRIPASLGPYILDHVERLIAHRFDDIAPIRSIARVRCPVLLVHGQHDKVVPLADALRLREARRNGEVELFTVPGGHASFTAVERQMAVVAAFLRRHCMDGRGEFAALPRHPPLQAMRRPPERRPQPAPRVISLDSAAARLRRRELTKTPA